MNVTIHMPVDDGPAEQHFSTVQVVRMTGLSIATLTRYCQLGWIPGQAPDMGSGTRRRWTREQADRALMLADASRLRGLRVDEIANALADRPPVEAVS